VDFIVPCCILVSLSRLGTLRKDDTISVFISQGQVQYQLLTELEGCLSWLLTGINMYLLNLNRVKGSVLVSGDTKVHLSDYSNNFEFLEGRD
jgi:hypothetical protein